MSQQYLRRVGLLVVKGPTPHIPGNETLDLSEMHIQFRVSTMDFGRPTTVVIRVYNLSTEHANSIFANEFKTVSLLAGYQGEGGNYGSIFQGTIKQCRKGRLSNIDSFVDIYAADSDEFFTFGRVNTTIAKGQSQADYLNGVVTSVNENAATGAQKVIESGTLDFVQAGAGGPVTLSQRGKVMFGVGRLYLNNIANSTNTTWSVENGKVNFTKRDGYRPGTVVVLTSKTGLIGMPEADLEGIYIKCLLNPLIKVGCRVQIDNKSINQLSAVRDVQATGGFPSVNSPIDFPAATTEDGIYRVLVVEHNGDTRGGERSEWFTSITALALDRSAAVSSAVVAGIQ